MLLIAGLQATARLPLGREIGSLGPKFQKGFGSCTPILVQLVERKSFVTNPEIRQAGIVDVTFGENVTVIQPVNLYGCTIGDNTFVGPFVEIQKGASVGERCRIQSHSFICERVTIGDDCFISHGAMFINDRFVAGGPSPGRDDWRPTRIGNRVSIGTNATILPVRICERTVIGAGSVVTKDITEPGFYVGNPARLLRRVSPISRFTM
jgi:acetyltransferase-like isoleucine patch superfamily enzyme